MTSTPPFQIVSTPQTPPTPLHGAAYDRRTTRASSRIAAKQVCSTPNAPQPASRVEAPVTTPKSRQSTSRPNPGIHSPDSTPRNKATRRVQIISPSSPDTEIPLAKPMSRSRAHLQPPASSSTTISDGMLPTPVKTPKKKPVTKVNNAARALFQDNAPDPGGLVEFQPHPKRNRKSKRYNGFSLESFTAAEEVGQGQIQIFTDSRDRVPQIDMAESNPFIEREMNGETATSHKITGTSKRRKVSEAKKTKVDPQVADAIEEDEGMVYVFRGKKVYRRFDDEDDEEEEIDADDLGLLGHSPTTSNTKPIKTLTRRSIKPKRLFESETKKRAREAEEEEEAVTDIEESTGSNEDAPVTDEDSGVASPTLKTGRSLRSTGAANLVADEAESNGVNTRSGKKTSPFDSWPRLKSGTSSVVAGQKSKKRSAPDVAGETTAVTATEPKRTKV